MDLVPQTRFHELGEIDNEMCLPRIGVHEDKISPDGVWGKQIFKPRVAVDDVSQVQLEQRFASRVQVGSHGSTLCKQI